MWMVRAGENAFLFEDFNDLNIIAVGWEVGDLSGKSPDEIKQIMADKYYNVSKTSLSIQAAQVVKFVCEFKIGDFVITYNPRTRKYLVGKIISDYYYSDMLSKKYMEQDDFYSQFRDVEWMGEVLRDDLGNNTAKSLNGILTIFNIQDSAKNDLLYKINQNKIDWPDFYMELADKLIDYKDNRADLIYKIQNIFQKLNMDLPALERDSNGNNIIPYDMDPFTVFALFNKQISAENRINLVKEFKKEFDISAKAPFTFHGIAVVNNLKATFYGFNENRQEKDINNLWNLFESALNHNDDFIQNYDEVINQRGVRWNITMALNWIRPFDYINMDSNNRTFLTSEEIFSNDFKEEIKSLKSPPSGKNYLKICQYCEEIFEKTGKYENFPIFSHAAYLNNLKTNGESSDDGIGDGDVKTVKYWMYSPGEGATMWDTFYDDGIMAIGWEGVGNLSKYSLKDDIKYKLQELYNDKSSHRNDVHALWQFANEIQIGDVIFAKRGMSDVIGVGIVESDYEFKSDMDHYQHIRKVNWKNKGIWPYEQYGKLPMKTLTDITIYTEMINNIKELIGGTEIMDEPP